MCLKVLPLLSKLFSLRFLQQMRKLHRNLVGQQHFPTPLHAPQSQKATQKSSVSPEQEGKPSLRAPAAEDGRRAPLTKAQRWGRSWISGQTSLSQSHPANKPSLGRKHHQLNLVRDNLWHLLVQNEVQVKSPVAGWIPFLPASPMPGTDEHESG